MAHDLDLQGTPEPLRTFYLQHGVDLGDMGARYAFMREQVAWSGGSDPTLSELEQRFLEEHLTVGGKLR